MKFEINNYGSRTAMHCPTQEASDIFMQYLNDVGECWCTGESYLSHSSWHEYGRHTCYAFKQGKCCDIDWYIESGFQILEFDDFDWKGEAISESELCISFADVLYGKTEAGL